MRDRFVSLAGAVIALIAVITLLFQPTRHEGFSLPTSQDNGDNGKSVLVAWLKELGFVTSSLQQRYQHLETDPQLESSGNLLIITLPFKIEARSRELEALRRWVAEGNSLIVLSARSDLPKWALERSSKFDFNDQDLLLSLGFYFYEQSDRSEGNTETKEKVSTIVEFSQNLFGSGQSHLIPRGNHPLLNHIDRVETDTHLKSQLNWGISSREDYRSTLELLDEVDDLGPALWQLRIGQGRLWVSRFSTLFDNSTISRADNAQLLFNLVQDSVSESGVVLIDDMHQGITRLYDPAAFYSDPRLYNSIWFLIVFWFILVIGHSNRLAPANEMSAQHSAADFVRGVGNLFSRKLSSRFVANELLTHMFNDIRTQYGLPTNGQPVWHVLEKNAQIEPEQLNALKNVLDRIQHKKKIDLNRTRNLTLQIRKSLL